jgi:hypothetical protein
MADRFWVGGTASWDATAGTKWAATSGGAGGQSVPTSADDVFFDNLSTGTVTPVTAQAICRSLSTTGFTGTLTGSGTIIIHGSLTIGTVTTWNHTGSLDLRAASGSFTITTSGKTLGATGFGFTGISTATWTLSDALTSSGSITVTSGTLTTNNFNVTATSLSSSNSNTRTINLGSSTVTLSASSGAVNFITNTNLTFNAGTSSIVLTNASATFAGGSQTFNNVSFTSTSGSTHTLSTSSTFNNLSVTGRTTTGISALSVNADQTINGTLTLSAGTDATRRAFVRSNTIGTTRTLTCAAVASLTDIDFRDITIAGAAAPVSGTRLGDCKGNSGITFPAAKTVYYRGALNANWNSLVWSFTNGGTADVTAFPLAQDTAVFPSSPTPYPTSGNTATINADYNIGTIDMSARTGNTMTLATGSNTPAIYGNWINGTGTTITGTGVITFAGRGSQTITSAGKSFTQNFTIDTPSGSVTLQDALTGPGTASLTFTSGTFNLNTYNATVNGFSTNNSNTRTLAVGSGTLTLTGGGSVFNAATATNFTVTGTGTISMTSASAKTFAGGGIQTYPTLNQGGTGTLTVTGSNKFADITNTAIGRVQFSGGTTNIFTAFNLNGVSGNLLQLGSTNTTQATLQKSSAWLMGANSTDAGNNTGLSFTAGGGIDYLSVSYINGQVVGGGYTIAANNGTYTVTGQSATLSRSRLITSDTGYYNVVGYPATIVISGSPIIVTDQLLIKLRSFTERRRF